jgi:release factor glutamine methyltransferase
MNLEEVIKNGSKKLKKGKVNSSLLDAEIILSDLMGTTREFLITNTNINIPNSIKKKFNQAINRRINNEPVAYIIGKRDFWSETFKVSKATLIPRPETELLIYKVIKFFRNRSINILDIGTGSGCILLSILKELKFSRGTGIDISNSAIKIAIKNARKFNLSNRSKFEVCDIDKFNFGKYDLIVSNPPYIPSKEIKELSKDIRSHEPEIAINGGKDGLDLIKKVIYKSSVLLKRNGLFAIEIGTNQYLRVSTVMNKYGFRLIGKEFDYNNNVRCIISTKV